jgi:hypothetical protein
VGCRVWGLGSPEQMVLVRVVLEQMVLERVVLEQMVLERVEGVGCGV